MKYIIWDFDGTLAYREGLWTGTLMSVLQKNNITSIRRENIRPFLSIGFPWNSPDSPHQFLFDGKSWWEYMESNFEDIFGYVGLERHLAKHLAKQVRDEYINVKFWHLYEDVIPTLEKSCACGFRNVILSNHVPELSQIVEALEIKNYFFKIFSSANIGFDKPNKKIYQHVLNKLSINKTECIMIGDSYEADVAGALRSGIKAILVRKNNEKEYPYYSLGIYNVVEKSIELLKKQ